MDADKVCSLLETLRVVRLLFLGDSLTHSQFTSFVNKMGPRRIADLSGSTPAMEASLLCGVNHQRNSTIVPMLMTREHGGGQAFPRSPRTNLTFPNRTRDFIESSSDRVLIVANIGAHYHKLSHYQEDLDLLFAWFDRLRRHNDLLVYFRRTPSGHRDCSPRFPRSFNFTAGIRDRPLASYAEFQPMTKFGWHLFDHYNVHTRQVVEKRRQQSNQEDSVNIRLLDVVNMTLLRSDGHSGGLDCLHYSEPGPVDWWNHLLYTLLKEEAATKDSEEHTGISGRTAGQI